MQRNSFRLTVQSNNPLIHGHTVQLRPARPASFAVVDSTSPILALQLTNGTLHSENPVWGDPISPLGPVGGLRNLTDYELDSRITHRQAFIFRDNDASAARSFKMSVNGWELFNIGEGGRYWLYYSKVTIGYVNGFSICNVNDGEYYQLIYSEGLVGEDFPDGCEPIALEVSPVMWYTFVRCGLTACRRRLVCFHRLIRLGRLIRRVSKT